MKPLFLSILLICSDLLCAQQFNSRPLPVPDIPGYKTLKCDLHMHTVFSDGYVWPTVRVEEAYREGLDVIAITDHIEYRPFRKDVVSDHNRSFEIAKKDADRAGIILLKGSEITRSMPPGHLNALFLKDSEALDKEDVYLALQEAKNQGAYIFWNHPGWKVQAPDGIKWYDMHTELFNKGLIHGIEVVNYNEFYPEALLWCKDKKLTPMANSDMHGTLDAFLEQNEVNNRPITLVFAEDKTEKGIRDALLSGRTIAWFDKNLYGDEKLLQLLCAASLELSPPHFSDENNQFIRLKNHSAFHFYFMENGEKLHLYPMSSMILRVSKNDKSKKIELLNVLSASGKVSLDLLIE